jgi:hypothetical protein
MKKYALAMLILLCSSLSLHAAIINGFLQEKQKLEKEIQKTVELLNNHPLEKTKKQLEKKLRQMRKKYAKVSKNYSQTAELLTTFEFIDPELYSKVSKVLNAEGTLTHVYVRYVDKSSDEFTYFSREHFNAKAYTSVSPSADHPNVCTSLYGTNTITVTIGIGCDELIALAHEFAHVLYMVPNLKEYVYFMKYRNSKINLTAQHGHSWNDTSSTFMKSIENSFTARYENYLGKTKISNSTGQNISLGN